MATIEWKIRGVNSLRKQLRAAPEITNRASTQAMQRTVSLLRTQMSARSPIGPGHFGEHLGSSWETNIASGARRVYGDVFTLLPEGKWLDTGTKAHDIPARGRSLVINGAFAGRSVAHPGVKARHTGRNMLRQEKPLIVEFFLAAYNQAIRELGDTSGG